MSDKYFEEKAKEKLEKILREFVLEKMEEGLEMNSLESIFSPIVFGYKMALEKVGIIKREETDKDMDDNWDKLDKVGWREIEEELTNLCFKEAVKWIFFNESDDTSEKESNKILLKLEKKWGLE